jgi:hypothetical protein
VQHGQMRTGRAEVADLRAIGTALDTPLRRNGVTLRRLVKADSKG